MKLVKTAVRVFGLFALLSASEASAVCNVTILTGPGSPTSSQNPTFTFSQSGCGHGVLQCKLDGGAYSNCNSPKSYTGVSPDGAHTFYLRYYDAPLALDTDTWGWTIDTTPPNTTITSGPAAYTNDPRPGRYR